MSQRPRLSDAGQVVALTFRCHLSDKSLTEWHAVEDDGLIPGRVLEGTLKIRDWNMQDWKIRHQLGTRKVGNTASWINSVTHIIYKKHERRLQGRIVLALLQTRCNHSCNKTAIKQLCKVDLYNVVSFDQLRTWGVDKNTLACIMF